MKKKEVEEKHNEIADAIRYAARHLGTNDAATPMGALEAHASLIADAINSHASTLSSSFEELADAIRLHAETLGDLADTLDPSRLQPSIDKHFTACAGGQTPQESEVTDSFIVTQGDKVLCRDCFTREVTGSNPKMRKCGTRKYGRCSYCSLEILYPKTMVDWKQTVSEVERDLNTGKEKTDA
jgi:hypothetical protein